MELTKSKNRHYPSSFNNTLETRRELQISGIDVKKKIVENNPSRFVKIDPNLLNSYESLPNIGLDSSRLDIWEDSSEEINELVFTAACDFGKNHKSRQNNKKVPNTNQIVVADEHTNEDHQMIGCEIQLINNMDIDRSVLIMKDGPISNRIISINQMINIDKFDDGYLSSIFDSPVLELENYLNKISKQLLIGVTKKFKSKTFIQDIQHIEPSLGGLNHKRIFNRLLDRNELYIEDISPLKNVQFINNLDGNSEISEIYNENLKFMKQNLRSVIFKTANNPNSIQFEYFKNVVHDRDLKYQILKTLEIEMNGVLNVEPATTRAADRAAKRECRKVANSYRNISTHKYLSQIDKKLLVSFKTRD